MRRHGDRRPLVQELETVLADLLEEIRNCRGPGMANMGELTQQRYEAGEAVLARLRKASVMATYREVSAHDDAVMRSLLLGGEGNG